MTSYSYIHWEEEKIHNWNLKNSSLSSSFAKIYEDTKIGNQRQPQSRPAVAKTLFVQCIPDSQQDYEEYIIMENVDQRINQQNIGSGSSTNINCGTNIAGTNLLRPITCPSIPGETPGTTVIPVVTQREGPVVTASGSLDPGGEEIAQSRAECLQGEVVTGGGWERIDSGTGLQFSGISKENKEGNAWVVSGSSTGQAITFKAYAECLKLIPS